MSPLGKYAPLTAAVTAIGIIGVYLVGLVLTGPLAIPDASLANLHDIALVAVGAVFGSAVAVNGWKGPVQAMHTRLDKAGIPAAGDGEE